MRSVAALVGLVLASHGCGFQSGATPDAGGGGGGGGESGIPVPAPEAGVPLPDTGLPDIPLDACVTFSGQLNTCLIPLTDDVVLDGKDITYNTETHKLVVGDAETSVAFKTLSTRGKEVDAIVAHNVRITAESVLRVTGSRPFAIVASGTITIEHAALVDVGNGGAGALMTCSTPAGSGDNNGGGGGGGGGGAYSADGGDGGKGNGDAMFPATPSKGGSGAGSIGTPAGPQGGCAGAPGGNGNLPGGMGGVGGRGGGVLYLVAAGGIELGEASVLDAGGGGGSGGANEGGNGDAGGGGGGSGGMILLEAPRIAGPRAQVAANGGGGGEGSSDSQAGHPGARGLSTAARAPGGNGGPDNGADGGRGGSKGALVGETVMEVQNGGGGGGGGGVGFILIVSPDIDLGTMSPGAVSPALVRL